MPSFPRHRVFYFPDLFKVDDARLALLKDKVLRDGNVVVWGPGSGLSDGTTLSSTNVERLTGFKCDVFQANYPHRVLISNFEHPITRGLKPDTLIGSPLPYGPLVFPTNGAELGRAWTKQGRAEAGLAVKEFGRGARGAYRGNEPLGAGDYSSVFTHAIPLPADLWRNLARYAGAHVYSDSGDVLVADSSLVAIHSLQSGPRQVMLPGRFNVTDVVTGKAVGRKVDTIRFDMQAPETRVFRLEPSAGARQREDDR